MDGPTVRASDVPTNAILPDNAGWWERNRKTQSSSSTGLTWTGRVAMKSII